MTDLSPERKEDRLPLAGRWRALVLPAVLVLIAILYYGQYYDSGFNEADEGNIALISKRLLEGETPYVDVRFGAGLAWPYSIVGLFRLVGVDFVAMKIFFFGLATVTALLGYAIVARLGSRRWLGFVAGLQLLLLPGVVHKAFLPLAVVANMYLLTRNEIGRGSAGIPQVAAAAAVVAFTCLLRTDLGLFVAAVLLVLIAWESFLGSRSVGESVRRGVRSVGLALGVFVLVLVPAFAFAASRGFLAPFLRTFYRRPEQLLVILQARLVSSGSSTTAEIPGKASTLLAAPPIRTIWQGGTEREWAVLTYLPAFVLLAAALVLMVALIRRCRQAPRLTGALVNPWTVLFLMAISTFPQFILRRPDVAHLSQFMPGYTVFSCFVIGECLDRLRRDAWFWTRRDRVRRAAAGLTIAILALNLGLYAWSGWSHPATGSIARSKGATELLEARNGVRVYLTPRRHSGLSRLREVIERYSGPGDSVFCFPYAPGLNLMTDRPTGLRVQFASDLSNPSWQDETIEKMRELTPAAVIISDWAVNGTEISRFPNWATRVMAYVDEEYRPLDEVLSHTVYVRRDLVVQ